MPNSEKNSMPSESEVKKFWDKLHVYPHIKITNVKYHAGMAMDGSGNQIEEYPPINIANLFEYAVPKLDEEDILVQFRFAKGEGRGCVIAKYHNRKWVEIGASTNPDPALALFWAI